MTNGHALAVLDTNVVLDWLLFYEPGVAPVVHAVESDRLRWLVCPRMRDELAHTLGKPSLAAWHPDAKAVLAAFDRHAVMCPPPPPAPSLRCDDVDDQVFVDLAVAQGAGWLLTHDRALLRLKKRTAALGLAIVTPSEWHMT